MVSQTKRNHLGRVAAVLTLIYLVSATGALPRSVCLKGAASYHLGLTACPEGRVVTNQGKCEINSGAITCRIREGDNTIIVIAEEANCRSDFVTLGSSPVTLQPFNQTRVHPRCPKLYKIGQLHIASNRAQLIPFRWPRSDRSQCDPQFYVLCS